MKIFAPGFGFSMIFLLHGAGVLHFLCAGGLGICPFKKIPQKSGLEGGMVRLGIE